MVKQCSPRLEASRYFLAMVVKYEYTGLGDAGLPCCCKHMFEQFRLNEKESSFGSIDMVDKLVRLVCWIGAGEHTAKCHDTVHNDRIVDLCRSLACVLTKASRRGIFSFTSLKECMQTQSPFFSPTALKPATSFRM